MPYDRRLNQYLDHEHDIPSIERIPGAAGKIRKEVENHATNKKNPHNVTPEQVGKDKAQWNADKINGTKVDDTFKKHGFGLGYNKETDKMEYFPYGDERFYDHNQLKNYEPLEHSKLDDEATSKKRVWSSAKTGKELATKVTKMEVAPSLEKISKTMEEMFAQASMSQTVVVDFPHQHPAIDRALSYLYEKKADADHTHNEFDSLQREDDTIKQRIGDLDSKVDKLADASTTDRLSSEVSAVQKTLREIDYFSKKTTVTTPTDNSGIETLAKEIARKADLRHEHAKYALKSDLKVILKRLDEKKPAIEKRVTETQEEWAPLNHRHRIKDVIGLTEALATSASGLPDQTGNSGKFLTTNGTVASWGTPVSGGTPAWGSITGTLSDQTDLQSALDAKQPLDSDLTTIAGLTATTNNFIVSVSNAWASRTPAQVKTTLSLDNVDNTSDANKPVSTATQTALNLKQNSLGYTPEDVANKSTSTSLGASNTLYPTQNAVKTYVDAQDALNQPLDSDLTAIAALTPSNDDFIQRKSGAWTNRTPAQVKTDLGLTGTNSGDQNLFSKVAVSGQPDVTASSATTTLELVAGSNITLTTDNTAKTVTITSSGTGGGGSGIQRTITTSSSNVTLGNTASMDYVDLATGTHDVTLPTAVSNTNRYTVNNAGSGTITVKFTSAQTGNGSTSLVLLPDDSVDLISNNANWRII